MTNDTRNYPALPIDAALANLSPETREVLTRTTTDLGGLSLLGVMSAQYEGRQGAGAGQDYLDSVAEKEGEIVPVEEVYDRCLNHFDRLIGKELPSTLRERLTEGNQSLPEGTLLHAMRFDLGSMTTITLTGVVAREFSPDLQGDLVDDMRGHAYFFRAPKDTSVSRYMDKLAKDSPMAQKMLPGTENGGDSIVMIFDSEIDDPDYQALIAAQSEQYAKMPKSNANDAVAIPIGLPAGAVAGFIVGENIASDETKLDYVRSLFPDTPFLSPDGSLVA